MNKEDRERRHWARLEKWPYEWNPVVKKILLWYLKRPGTTKEKLKKYARILMKLLYRTNVYGLENIPKEGKVLMVMNHISLIECAIGAFVERDIIMMAGSKLWKDPIIATILDMFNVLPVNLEEFSKETLDKAVDILNEGNIFGLCPEGTRNHTKKEPPKNGVGYIAFKSKAPAIPILVDGEFWLFKKTNFIIGPAFSYDGIRIKDSGEYSMKKIYEAKNTMEVNKPKVKTKVPKSLVFKNKTQIYE